MTLNGVMAVRMRYFTEFGTPAFQHYNRVGLWRNLCIRVATEFVFLSVPFLFHGFRRRATVDASIPTNANA